MYEKQLRAVARLLEVMDRLRAECPWDREQTFESLRNNTIEEVFELADAIADGAPEHIREELGDVLLHVVFYSKMADEQGWFDLADVADALCDKLIFRHPHVYGQIEADDSGQVIRNWEQLKALERRRDQRKADGGVLSGVPRSLPALVKAYRVGEKAAAAGFDWEQPADVWDKVREEVGEVSDEIAAGRREGIEEELGDLFFALVNASRLYGVDPEMALEKANRKFIRRFGYIEREATAQGRSLREMSLDEMETLWQQAKCREAKGTDLADDSK